MTTKLSRSIFATLLFVLVSLIAYQVADAVDLITFTASYDSANNRVNLYWETAAEVNNAGFFIRRSQTTAGLEDANSRIFVIDTSNGAYTKFVFAQEDGESGGAYDVYDPNPIPGTSYYYQLESVDLNNVSEFHDSILVQAGTVADTPTPSITPQASQTQTDIPATATLTSTPTQTPIIPTNSPTLLPSLSPTTAPTQVESETPDIQMTLTAAALALTQSALPTASFTPTPSATLTPEPTPTATSFGLPDTFSIPTKQIQPEETQEPDTERASWVTWPLLLLCLVGLLILGGIIFFILRQRQSGVYMT